MWNEKGFGMSGLIEIEELKVIENHAIWCD
jgi:hypothetical protein